MKYQEANLNHEKGDQWSSIRNSKDISFRTDIQTLIKFLSFKDLYLISMTYQELKRTLLKMNAGTLWHMVGHILTMIRITRYIKQNNYQGLHVFIMLIQCKRVYIDLKMEDFRI